jgi:DTW domain-containing protein YfiP
MLMRADFLKYLETLPGISLDEMSAIRLMNRTDRKYLATEEQLLKLLEMAQDDYMVQVINDKRYAEYQTTYFDDDDYTMYIKHHNGFLRRQKVRVRQYLTTGDVFF